MGGVVKLSVHKNNAWQRAQHKISDALVQSARVASRHKGTAGFVIVSWNGDGETSVAFDLSRGVVPRNVVPSFVLDAVTKALE